MKIGVISDTHGSAAAWQRAVDNHFQDADLIIHTGDVLYHGPRNPFPQEYNPAGLAELINKSPVPVVFARGNCDADVDQLLINYPIQSPYTFIQWDKLRILATHGDKLYPTGGDLNYSREAARLGAGYRATMVIFGHIHQPVLEAVDGVVILNPGSVSLPKAPYPPSVAIIDDKGISIINIEKNQIIMSYHWEE